jgi:hypothetical protein
MTSQDCPSHKPFSTLWQVYCKTPSPCPTSHPFSPTSQQYSATSPQYSATSPPDYKVLSPEYDFTPLYPTRPYWGIQAQNEASPTDYTTYIQGKWPTINFKPFFTYKFLGSDDLRLQNEFNMSNVNVHLMIEKMDTTREDMV